MRKWLVEIARRITFALSVALLGLVFSIGAAIVLGIAGWIHGVFFEQVYPLQLSGELFLNRMLSSLGITIYFDLPLVFWSTLLGAIIYKHRISFRLSFLLMLLVVAQTLAFRTNIGSYLASLINPGDVNPPSFWEILLILFMGMLWLGCETASFALALSRPWRR